MISETRSLIHLLLVSSLLCASCKSNSSESQPPPAPPAPQPSEQPAATAAEQAAPPPAAEPPPPPKNDAVDAEGLKAGLAAMKPRITAQIDGIAKIEPTAHSRFFMHPGDDKDPSLDFNTKGLTSLELAPYIEDFGTNTDCRNSPNAGVVQLTWSVDGGKKNQVMVDRNYTATIPVTVAKSSHLKLEVDKGNGTPLCDWFSVGFVNVK